MNLTGNNVEQNLYNQDTMEKEEIVISIKNVSKTFFIREKSQNSIMDRAFNFFSSTNRKVVKALENINLDIKKGEFFSIIGRNGSGKSTLLKIISGAFPPDKNGGIIVKGRLIRLSLGMGFDGNLTARENIYLNGSIMGLSFRFIGKKFDEIITFSGIEGFVDTQVKYYSSGMISRLAFAIAIHVEADILLMDEFFGGVGDEDFKLKSEAAFKKFLNKDKTIILVSHNLNDVMNHSDRVLYLDKGKPIALGKPEVIIPKYLKSV